MITANRLRELLDYDHETGWFTWVVSRPHRPAGSRAGTTTDNGYRAVSIDGTRYYEHRLVWLWMAGTFPPEEIDHINRQRHDNRFCNLRCASRCENGANRASDSNNRHGFMGIWQARNGRYAAGITKNGRKTFLGYFDTAEEAHGAYAQASIELRGSFAPAGSAVRT